LRKCDMAAAAEPADSTLSWQILVGALLLGGWEAAGWAWGPAWISRPSLVADRIAGWGAGGDLYLHIGTTAVEMLVGLGLGTLFGTLAGLLLGRQPVLAVTLRPIIVAAYSVPLITLAPLLIMFFGLDMMPKIVLISIVVFFLLFFNTFTGAAAVDQDLISALELMGSTRREEFQKVIAPASMVWVISGVKIALPYALVAAVTGEMLAARRGLGFLLSQAAAQFNMTSLYSVLFILMVMGLAVAALADRLERWLLRWRHAAA
jgi:NitT/TauT family transport system permease protein